NRERPKDRVLMKKLLWTTLLALGCANAPAAIYGSHYGGSGYWHGGHHSHSSFSFSFGLPYYSYYPSYYYPPAYAYPFSYSYPGYAYSYAPAYSYPAYSYGYARPNYAVGGTLLGALMGGLIGDAKHHHVWEGA